jgi:hypothetical protein
LSYGRTEATALSFCSVFGACTGDVVAPLRQNLVLATLTALGTFPRVNSPIDPTRGRIGSVEATFSSKYIGSSSLQQFTRVSGGMSWYRPLSRNVVLSWRVRGGLIFSPTLDVANVSGAFIPPDQRFYAGGPNDVRGFDRNELGPVVYVVPPGVLSAGSDEVPGVYKDIHAVMAEQRDLVDVVGRFDPKIVKMCDDGSRAED